MEENKQKSVKVLIYKINSYNEQYRQTHPPIFLENGARLLVHIRNYSKIGKNCPMANLLEQTYSNVLRLAWGKSNKIGLTLVKQIEPT